MGKNSKDVHMDNLLGVVVNGLVEAGLFEQQRQFVVGFELLG